MSRSFDIKLDKISEFYQAFTICVVQSTVITIPMSVVNCRQADHNGDVNNY